MIVYCPHCERPQSHSLTGHITIDKRYGMACTFCGTIQIVKERV